MLAVENKSFAITAVYHNDRAFVVFPTGPVASLADQNGAPTFDAILKAAVFSNGVAISNDIFANYSRSPRSIRRGPSIIEIPVGYRLREICGGKKVLPRVIAQAVEEARQLRAQTGASIPFFKGKFE